MFPSIHLSDWTDQSSVLRLVTLLGLVILSGEGCDRQAPLAPSGPEVEATAGQMIPATGLRVATWNVFVGADLESVFEPPPDVPFPVLAANLWNAVQSSRFEDRADAIARAIASDPPHLVALQEVSEFRVQSPGDILLGQLTPNAGPEDVQLDFLALLMAALEDHELAYSPAVVSRNFDVEVPVLTASGIDDIRLLDHDVILVRGDVTASRPETFNFTSNFELSLSGLPIVITRGFAHVDASVDGRHYRVAVAHLEPAGEGGAEVQEAQAAEMLAVLAGSELPTLLLGDFNSGPHRSSTRSYELIRGAGFVDLWTAGRPRGEGATCCREPDLSGTGDRLTERVDLIFYRDRRTPRTGVFPGAVSAERLGVEPRSRTSGGLWPSDHAGVVAELRPAPEGRRREAGR